MSTLEFNNRPKNYRKRWTKEEIDLVNEFADSLKSQEELAERSPALAESMGRPISTVNYKVEKRRNWYSRNTDRKTVIK